MDKPSSLETRIEQYVTLRERIREIEKSQKEHLAPFREALEQLGNFIMSKLGEVGVESVRAASGTAYLINDKSATIADGEAFLNYVRESENFDLIDRRANKLAIADFVDKYGAPPPGVNFRVERKLGIRKS